MKKLLLNCDLGEWESAQQARALIAEVDLINIACGGHAGSAEQITLCKEVAQKAGVQTGAHPGTEGNKGRLTTAISVEDFTSLLDHQIAFYRKYAGEPAHLKLHGSLYHLTEQDHELRQTYLDYCEKHHFTIVALAQGNVVLEGKKRGLPILEEAFLDRRTLPNGQLMPRTEPNAVITDLKEILSRIPEIQADTVCVHSDSPKSLEMVRAAREVISQRS